MLGKLLFSVATIVVVGGFALVSFAGEREQEHLRTSSAMTKLSDDDDGTPLFAVTNLKPGRPIARCLRVTYGGSARAPVTLAGAGPGGSLDKYLDLDVEAGAGGRYGDCSGFSGERLFHGSLAEFLELSASPPDGIAAWTATEREPARTFRFSLRLKDVAEAQGGVASASFEWRAREDEANSPEKSGPPSGPPASSSKPPSSGAERADGESGARGRSPSRRPHLRQDLVAPRKPSASSPSAPASKDDGGIRRALAALARVAEATAKRAVFPFFLALIALSFALVQNRLDRRDPKLALAPIHRDPDLPFGPVLAGGGGRP